MTITATNHATAYHRDGRFYISADSRDRDGVWRSNAEVFAVESDETDRLNEAISKALTSSVVGIANPSRAERDELPKKLLKALGHRSFASFMNGTKCICISIVNGKCYFQPTKNGGAKFGFTPLSPENLSPKTETEDMATALRAALSASI